MESTINKKITIAIFDLDNTLIDTERIKAHLDRAAMEQGLDRVSATVVYQLSRTKAGKVKFDLAVYQENLKELLRSRGLSFNQASYDQSIASMRQDPELLLPGARELLELSAKQNLRIIILSLGESDWQEEKIKFSGLGKVIDSIEDRYGVKVERKYTTYESHLAEEVNLEALDHNPDGAAKEIVPDKGEALREILSGSSDGREAVLFNDKPGETGWLLRNFPELRAYVRQAIDDVRYHESDFVALAKEYAGRVDYNQSLLHLKEIFAQNLIKEYEPRKENYK